MYVKLAEWLFASRLVYKELNYLIGVHTVETLFHMRGQRFIRCSKRKQNNQLCARIHYKRAYAPLYNLWFSLGLVCFSHACSVSYNIRNTNNNIWQNLIL